MLDPLVIAAIVEVLYALAQAYLPQLPISRELVHAIVVALLGLFVFRAGVRPLARKFWPQLEERGLLSRD